MFGNGNQAWKNRKYNNGGQLTNQQREKIGKQLEMGLDVIDFILSYKPSPKEMLEWCKLKADCLFKILNKYSADQIEIKELAISDRFIEFAGDLTSRISGFSKGNGRHPEITHSETGMQEKH